MAAGSAEKGAEKRALREAAERIERGIEAYAAGDVAGALKEFDEALKLQPQNARAQVSLSWVRDLAAGKRSLESKLDEDALQAVADALPHDFAERSYEGDGGEEEKTREKRHAVLPSESESPWDPVPLTPGKKIDAMKAGEGAPARAVAPKATLLGISGFDGPQLTPTRQRKTFGTSSDEGTGSGTREWKPTKTGSNMPPLDVPELTDEQIQELLALDGSPMLDVGAAQAPNPRLPTITDLGLGPDPEGESRLLEMTAEPTPEPHRNPFYKPPSDEAAATPTTELKAGPPDLLVPRPKDATTPDADVAQMRLDSAEFDTMEMTPTRERRDLLKSLARGPVSHSSDDELRLPPLVKTSPEAIEDGGTNPTNPFIRGKMAEYVSSSPQPKLDDLPLPPGNLGDTGRQVALEGIAGVQEALDAGNPTNALEISERFVESVGGIDSEACRPQHWLLEQVYQAVIGPLDRVPIHGTASADLDPRAAFLLSRLDGMSSLDDLLDVSGMPRLEALRFLSLLICSGVVLMR